MASIFDNNLMSKEDLKRIEQLENAWRSTDDKDLKKQLHNQAESIRNSYGYSGGEDGSEYNVIDAGMATAASAVNAYANALEQAEQNRQQNFSDQQTAADEQGRSRLREAYIKNLQSSLGLDQQLKADGISGGLSESTSAAYDNSYINQRNQINSDTLDAKREIAANAAQSAYDNNEKIAQLLYDSATDRADRLTAAQQTQYDREQDALDRDFANRQFEYQQQKDASDLDLENRQFEYQQQKDALDREYEEKIAALEQQYKIINSQTAAQKVSNSQRQQQIENIISLMKSGYYSPEFADILGIDGDKLQYDDNSDENIKEYAWDMLSHGVYHDSFPSILGYSKEVLEEFADMAQMALD